MTGGIEIGLMLEATAGADARLAAALSAAAVATVFLRPPGDHGFDAPLTRSLVRLAQARNAAALLVGAPALARELGADGVHLPWTRDPLVAYRAVRAALGRDAVVGCDAGTSRHDAMELGEAGATYIGFHLPAGDDPEEARRGVQLALVAWWAEIFEVPTVAFDIETPEATRRAARCGADMIALSPPTGLAPADVGAWLASTRRALEDADQEQGCARF
jgi:thiamine-phosphate pyrophosphorylase